MFGIKTCLCDTHRLVKHFSLKNLISRWFCVCVCVPVTTFPQGYCFEWFCSFIPIQFIPNPPLSIKSTENYSTLMWSGSWGGHCMPDFIRALPVYHMPLWKWLMNLSIWAIGVKSQILNENLIGDLMKNHFIRSLVELELYVLHPQEKSLASNCILRHPSVWRRGLRTNKTFVTRSTHGNLNPEYVSVISVILPKPLTEPFRAGDHQNGEDISHPEVYKIQSLRVRQVQTIQTAKRNKQKKGKLVSLFKEMCIWFTLLLCWWFDLPFF